MRRGSLIHIHQYFQRQSTCSYSCAHILIGNHIPYSQTLPSIYGPFDLLFLTPIHANSHVNSHSLAFRYTPHYLHSLTISHAYTHHCHLSIALASTRTKSWWLTSTQTSQLLIPFTPMSSHTTYHSILHYLYLTPVKWALKYTRASVYEHMVVEVLYAVKHA